MAALNLLLNQDKFNIDSAISVSGLQNQSSFDKSFKQRFGMSPKEAYNKKDSSLYTHPLAWECLSSGEMKKQEGHIVEEKELIFGIPREQYCKIVDYQECQALFDFDEIQSKVAYNFAEESALPIKVAFEITHKILEQYYSYGVEGGEMSVEDLQVYMPPADEVSYIYANVTQNVSTILELIEDSFGQIKDIEPFYIVEYIETYNTLWSLEEYIELIKEFVKFDGDDLEEYFELIEKGYTPEDAIKESALLMDESYDEKLDRLEVTRNWIEESKDVAFECWAAEETDYSKKI
jgi:AraC-like DNA-binding protein